MEIDTKKDKRKAPAVARLAASSAGAVAGAAVVLFSFIKKIFTPLRSKRYVWRVIGEIGVVGMVAGILLCIGSFAVKSPDVLGYNKGKIVRITAAIGANIRHSASMESKVIAVGKKGESFRFLKTIGEWHQILLVKEKSVAKGYVYKSTCRIRRGAYPIYIMRYPFLWTGIFFLFIGMSFYLAAVLSRNHPSRSRKKAKACTSVVDGR